MLLWKQGPYLLLHLGHKYAQGEGYSQVSSNLIQFCQLIDKPGWSIPSFYILSVVVTGSANFCSLGHCLCMGLWDMGKHFFFLVVWSLFAPKFSQPLRVPSKTMIICTVQLWCHVLVICCVYWWRAMAYVCYLSLSLSLSLSLCVWVCMCPYACHREREREREWVNIERKWCQIKFL